MIELNVKFLQENSEEKQETKKKAITFFLNIPKFFKYHNFFLKNFLISLKLLNIVKISGSDICVKAQTTEALVKRH